MKLDDKGNVSIDIARYHQLLETEATWKKVLADNSTHTLLSVMDSNGWGRKEIGILSNDNAVTELTVMMKGQEVGHKKDVQACQSGATKNKEYFDKKISERGDEIAELKGQLQQDALRIYRYSPVWDLLQYVGKIKTKSLRWNKKDIRVDKQYLEIVKAMALKLDAKTVK